MENCVYLGEKYPRTSNGGQPVYQCHTLGNCTQTGQPTKIASCEHCIHRLTVDDPYLASSFKDYLQVLDRTCTPTHSLRNMLTGCPAFVVCGGPSAKALDLEQLNQRGCWSIAVNNVAGWDRFKPNAFVCADPPSKFCDGIWLDPSVMKFIPVPKLVSKSRGNLRTKREESHTTDCPKCKGKGRFKGELCPRCKGEGQIEEWFDLLKVDGKQITTVDAPNVWAYERDAWLAPDDSFFLRESAAWGNHDHGVARTGEPKTVGTIICALRLAYYLGAREIFLVGVDFFMDPMANAEDNYSFGEFRTSDAVASNNRQYGIMNDWLCRLQETGVFKRFGVNFYNCNELSGLRAFPHVPFDDAIMFSRRNLPQEPFDLSGWYDK